MTTKTKICTIADVPEHLVGDWLKHLHDFDSQHPGCHFQVLTETPTKTVQEMVDILRENPKLTAIDVFTRSLEPQS